MRKRRATRPETDLVPDPFTVLRPRLVKALLGFSRELPENWRKQELESQGRPEPADFPLPDLVLFALRNVLEFSWLGPEEKTRWSVYGMFAGVLVSFEMRKFGFTICAAKGAKIELPRLYGQLQVAVKHVENWLKPLAKSQVTVGNVTVANRHYEFDNRYRFFRDLADQSYRRADKKPRLSAKQTKVHLLVDRHQYSRQEARLHVLCGRHSRISPALPGSRRCRLSRLRPDVRS